MQGYIGYIRVSTVKQGTKGVSLQEQRDAILRYAERNGFEIVLWLEEMETAAKHGRPVFNQALKLLRSGGAKGIILHKLDRGARNLRDWTAISELSDQGVEIHFVSESLDLQSRGGRLSADIQAVVSADYIRNLREETRKGFYGRLKQGLYPLNAPTGYLDQGKGKAKTIDPVKGPLVRQAFELYSTAQFKLETLGDELYRLGLRNHNGGRISLSGLSLILNNPFYFGLIRIRKTNETFAGIHEPIIGKALFDRVQAVLSGKVNARTQRHDFEFRRLLACATCRYSLIGERQKGHVYYRCHTPDCPKTSVREEPVRARLVEYFERLRPIEDEKEYIKEWIARRRATWKERREDEARSINLRLGQVKERMNRLTDAYLDQVLDKTMFEERKTTLLHDQKALEESLSAVTRADHGTPDRLQEYLELALNAWQSHQTGFPPERRALVRNLTSNLEVSGKNVDFKPSNWAMQIANRSKTSSCAPHRYRPRTLDIPRTWNRILKGLAEMNERGELPEMALIHGLSAGMGTTGDIGHVKSDVL